MYLLITHSCRDFSSIKSTEGFDRVPIDRADRTEIRSNPAGAPRERDLGKAPQRLLAVPIIIGIVVEDEVYDGKSS